MGKTCIALLIAAAAGCGQEAQPKEVDPGAPGGPPSDAIVLFGGKDLSEWVYEDGRPAAWPVIDGAVVSKSGTGHIFTRRRIGSAQIHVEFAIPNMPEATDQAKGNSGVYVQGRYEIQMLDSYQQPHLPQRLVRGGLRAVRAAGERQPPAGAVADLRHRLPRAAMQAGRHGRAAGHAHPAAQRRAGAGPRGAQGTHRRQRIATMRASPGRSCFRTTIIPT